MLASLPRGPSRAVRNRRLFERDKVAAVAAVRVLDCLARLFADPRELSAKPVHLLFHLHDELDTGEVQARRGQLLDATEAIDVAVAVAAASAARAGGVDQP